MNDQTHTALVVAEIAAERNRQKETEGWSTEHDDKHSHCDLSHAAAAYAEHAAGRGWLLGGKLADSMSITPEQGALDYAGDEAPGNWPWDLEWWKPKNPRRDLVRAAALIVAEIERLDRAQSAGGSDASR